MSNLVLQHLHIKLSVLLPVKTTPKYADITDILYAYATYLCPLMQYTYMPTINKYSTNKSWGLSGMLTKKIKYYKYGKYHS